MVHLSSNTITDALDEAQILQLSWACDHHFTAISSDSRNIGSNTLFIAIPGTSCDGHAYIGAAVESGATGLVFDGRHSLEKLQSSFPNIALFGVSDTRKAWALLEASFSRNPQSDLRLHAVTGTDGKTSVCWMATSLLNQLGIKAAYIGTLGFYANSKWQRKTLHTTPDPDTLYQLFTYCRENGIRDIIMEASSHSLCQQKLFGLKFSTAVFTNFSQDHLDYHKSATAYWTAKESLFRSYLAQDALAIIHQPLKPRLAKILKDHRLITYSATTKEACKTFDDLKSVCGLSAGTRISFRRHNVLYDGRIPYLGTHNVENFLAALLIVENISEKIADPDLWNNLPQIPGRMEQISKLSSSIKHPQVFIDFAHTPKGLYSALNTVQNLARGRLWLVFGCGGDRDRDKRPLMGQIAVDNANTVIVTSDNPRSEEPRAIIDAIVAKQTIKKNLVLIADRKEAISYAIQNASADDIILVTGKGHEEEQIVGDQTLPFSDKDVSQKLLETFWK